ncbi:hypothetical protein KL907_005143 [Ogataea polymorpha]|nr:hypothetical protein KL907_005143 [Ogataea polymorpha]
MFTLRLSVVTRNRLRMELPGGWPKFKTHQRSQIFCTIEVSDDYHGYQLIRQRVEELLPKAKSNSGVEDYSPLARGYKRDNPYQLAVARRRKKRPTEILIAWCLHKRNVLLPKAAQISRLEPNLEVFDIKLATGP